MEHGSQTTTDEFAIVEPATGEHAQPSTGTYFVIAALLTVITAIELRAFYVLAFTPLLGAGAAGSVRRKVALVVMF